MADRFRVPNRYLAFEGANKKRINGIREKDAREERARTDEEPRCFAGLVRECFRA